MGETGESLRDLVPPVPAERIARAPAEPRDSSLMLVVPRAGGELVDTHTRELPAFLRAGDLLVLNDTRVVPARLLARREATGGQVELLFLSPFESRRAVAMLQTRGTPVPGEELECPGNSGARLRLCGAVTGGRVELELVEPVGLTIAALLQEAGETPLPPYVLRARRAAGEAQATGGDRARYQTVYAAADGAVAAPTAGLHFTSELLERCAAAGARIERVTLHVGPGTFLPIRCADPREHPMEAEWASIPEATAAAVATTRSAGGRVIAVGTTTVRTLESAAARHGEVRAGPLEAGVYIHPPFEFQVIDGMLTNFHLPDATPCLLVAALVGRDRLRSAYEHALARSYRFYSYGDAMLIL